MPLLETLVVGLGTAVANGVLKMWLKDDPIALSTSLGIADILKSKVSDIMQRGSADRELAKIRDRSAQSFQQMLEKERSSLAESDIEIIANAAAAVINQTQLTPELLTQNSLNPDELTTFFLTRNGSQGGNPGLASHSDTARREIFRHLLLHASQQIVDISSRMPLFTERVFSELLQRENRIYEVAVRVLDGMDQLVAAQQGLDPEAERFETNYRLACVRRFDQLELFGVDLQESNKRYKLSVAYVTLEVEKTCIDELDEDGESDTDDFRESMPVDIALARSPRLLVRGLAGAGKTTLVQWATVFCAAKQHAGELDSFNLRLPFVITLRDFEGRQLPRPDEFARVTAPHTGGEPERWSHRILESGRAVVLIDGLDEAAEQQRDEVRQWLQNLLSQYSDARYVVTTRPHAVKEGWLDADDFLDATLQEMNQQDIGNFVAHWHAAVGSGLDDVAERQKLPALRDSLIQELARNPDLARLAPSPLLCAMLCALHRDRNQALPSDRVGLYRACLDMFFRRDRERSLNMRDYVDLTDEQKLLVLRSFAWWLIRNGKSSATPTETHQRLECALSELNNRPERATGESVTRLFIQRVSILRQFAAGKIDFPHRTFQEYLAALEALSDGDKGLVINNAEKEQWREVAILMAGLIENKQDAETFVLGLLQRGDIEQDHKETLYLIGAAAGQAVHRLPAASVIANETRRRLKQIIPPQSLRSAQGLAKAGNLVVPLLKYNKNWTTKHVGTSARALAMIKTSEANSALLDYASDTRATVLRHCYNSFPYLSEDIRSEFVEKFLWLGLQTRGLTPETATSLSALDLYGFHILTDCTPIANCKSLENLSLRSCAYLSNINALENCQLLHTLDLSNCTRLTDFSVLAKLPSLRTLSIRWLYSQIDWRVLLECNSLESLCCHTNYSLTDEMCSQLKQRLPKLTISS